MIFAQCLAAAAKLLSAEKATALELLAVSLFLLHRQHELQPLRLQFSLLLIMGPSSHQAALCRLG